MKLTTKKATNAVLLFVFASMTVTMGFNCSQFAVSTAPSITSMSTGSSDLSAPVAFMSSEQMVKAMISATGTEGLGEMTDPADGLINDTYNARSGSLPSVQSLTQATGPTLIAVTNLASSVCAKAVDRDVATAEAQRDQRLFFRELDFSKGLAGQSSDAVTLAFERIARNAWRRDVTSEETEGILTFAQEFSNGVNATDIRQTRMLAVSICTAALSSVDALTY